MWGHLPKPSKKTEEKSSHWLGKDLAHQPFPPVRWPSSIIVYPTVSSEMLGAILSQNTIFCQPFASDGLLVCVCVVCVCVHQAACPAAVAVAQPDRWHPFDQGDAVMAGRDRLNELLSLGLHEQAVLPVCLSVNTLTFLKACHLSPASDDGLGVNVCHSSAIVTPATAIKVCPDLFKTRVCVCTCVFTCVSVCVSVCVCVWCISCFVSNSFCCYQEHAPLVSLCTRQSIFTKLHLMVGFSKLSSSQTWDSSLHP